MKQSVLFLMLSFLAHYLVGQMDFYSAQDGDWFQTTTWTLDDAGTIPATSTPGTDDTVYIRDSVYQTVGSGHIHRGDIFISLDGVFNVFSGAGITQPYIFAGDTFAVIGKLITSSDFHNQVQFTSGPDGNGLLIIGSQGTIIIGDDLILNSRGVIQMDNASCGDGLSFDDMYFKGDSGRVCGNGRFVVPDKVRAWNNSNVEQVPPDAQLATQICPEFDFFGSQDSCLLSNFPIELLDFGARQKGDDVEIYWATASELNNHFFTIERSFDATRFEEIEIVQGAGNSTQKISYKTLDSRPGKGSIYYRLKQTDFDGAFTLSSIVEINIESDNIGFNMYPNPAGSQPFFIDLYGFQSNREAEISILDLSGRELFRKAVQTDYDGNVLVNLAPNLTSGIYLVKVNSLGKTLTRKLVY